MDKPSDEQVTLKWIAKMLFFLNLYKTKTAWQQAFCWVKPLKEHHGSLSKLLKDSTGQAYEWNL